MLDPRQSRIPDDLINELAPAGQDQRDVRVPAARRHQCTDIAWPPVGPLALVEGVDHQQPGAPGGLGGRVEDAEQVIRRRAELAQLASLG